jgi:membrane-associated phospholipid phosphatase
MADDPVAPLRLTQPRVWVIPALALAGMLVLAVTHGNEPVFLWLNAIGPATGDLLWANLTILGDTTVALALCLVLARRRPDLLWAATLAALFAGLWVHIYKPLFDVTRPPGVLSALHVIGPAHRYHSFPSGHTTTIFTLAGMCMLGFRLHAAGALPIVLAMLVAVSRCVVGVHWPMDLLGGACGGWLAAALGIRLASRLSFGRQPVVQWLLALAFAGCAVALLAGYDTGYAQALWLQRALGVAVLLAFAATFLKPYPGRAASG